MANEKKPYKRRIYFINPKFQLKFSLLMGILIVVSNLAYPVIIYQYIEYLIKFINETSTFRDFNLQEERRQVLVMLMTSHVVYAALIGVLCVFFSHKIAGPLYKLKKFLQDIRQGNPIQKVYFRKGDYFLEIADEVNETITYLQDSPNNLLAQMNVINENIAKLESSSENNTDLNEIKERLSMIQQKLQA